MPVVEYPDGASFPGVIGRTAEESSPAWPAPMRAPKGAPNVLFVVLDDTGFGQLGCYGSPIETPNFDALAADGLRYNNMHTTALCSPSRSCIITGRNHHSNAHGVHHRARHRLPRLQRHHAVRERHALRDAARAGLQHLHGRQVAPDAEQPGDRGRTLRPLAARPRLRALLRLPRRRHEPVVPRPGLRQPPGRAAGDARRRATTSARTWPTRRSSSSPTPSRSTPTSPSTCTSASARRTRPTTCPRSGPTSTPGKFDDGWDAYREQDLRPAEGARDRPGRRRALPPRP